MLIAGRTGAGKSTLATSIGAELGATMVSDDTVWLNDAHALSLGAPVAVRAKSPLRKQASALWYADDSERLLARAIDLGVPSVRPSGRVDLLVAPTFASTGSELRLMSPAETFCRLAEALLRPCSDTEIASLAALASNLSSAAVTYSDTATSLELCARFFQTVPEPSSIEPAPIEDEDRRRSGLCGDVQGMRFGDEIALWRTASAHVLHLRNWTGGPMGHTPAERTLRAMGFLERSEP